MELRREIERNLAETQIANQETLELAQKIVRSVRELSMLSVNARIEAARQASRVEVAVVANEIRPLADANSKWASEITTKCHLNNALKSGVIWKLAHIVIHKLAYPWDVDFRWSLAWAWKAGSWWNGTAG